VVGSGDAPIVLGVVVALVVALPLRGWAARRLGTGTFEAWLLLASIGLILAATLSPRPLGLESHVSGIATCDLSRVGPASLATYLRFADPTLNVLLFIPLGVLIGQLDRDQHRGRLVAGAAMLPIAIELIQALVIPLGRACQGGDVFDNLAGLTVGLVIGAVWRRARAPVRA
jgi:hypothetical protein